MLGNLVANYSSPGPHNGGTVLMQEHQDKRWLEDEGDMLLLAIALSTR